MLLSVIFFLREVGLPQQYLPYVTKEKAPLVLMCSLPGKGHELYLLKVNVGAMRLFFKFKSLAII